MNWLFDEARPERDTARDGAADLGAPSSLPCHRPRWPRRASAPASPASRAPPANGQPVSSAPPAGAGKTGTTDPAQPERTSRMVAHYLARGHRRARHRTRRRRPGPGRSPTLALPPPRGALLEACGQQVRPRRPSRRSGGVTGQCHDLSPWRSYAAGVEGSPPPSRPPGTNRREAVDAADPRPRGRGDRARREGHQRPRCGDPDSPGPAHVRDRGVGGVD